MGLEDAKTQVDLAFTRDDMRGLAFENAFAGAPSFLRRRWTKDVRAADLAVTGVPFDQAVTNRPGARFGPRAIREASSLMPFDPPHGWGFDPLSEFAIADVGDMALDYALPSAAPAAIEAHVGSLIAQGPKVLTLGGDHSITLPILRAVAAERGPVGIVQFDAHSDLWPDDDPARVDHGTFLYTAVREGLIDPARSVHVGIRTVCEDLLGVAEIPARRVHEATQGAIAADVRGIVGAGPCYVSFDIDALDPAFAPGTGTPVWGGLASWQASAILRDLAGLDVVGGDVVEVAPPYDTAGITAVAGAHAAFDIACLMLWNARKEQG
ncbi:MAG: agmatinase [Paracoccaceae bacterium]